MHRNGDVLSGIRHHEGKDFPAGILGADLHISAVVRFCHDGVDDEVILRLDGHIHFLLGPCLFLGRRHRALSFRHLGGDGIGTGCVIAHVIEHHIGPPGQKGKDHEGDDQPHGHRHFLLHIGFLLVEI